MNPEKNNEEQVLQAEVLPDAAITLITKAEIDTQIATAKTFPRSLQVFMKKCMSMATITEDVAQSCIYALPRGGKTLEGPSVRLAEIVAASYGNLRTGARVIYNDGKTVTAQGIVHDLEGNIFHTEEVQRSILQNEWATNPKSGKREQTGKKITMTEDMQVVAGRAACAIAYRNAIFKVVPAALIQDVYDKVKEVAKGSAETLVARRVKAIKFFTDRGIKETQIFDVLQVSGLEDIDLEKLQVLSGMKSALSNNEATLEGMFAPADPNASKAKAATDATLNKLKKNDGVKGTTQKMEEGLNDGTSKPE